MPELPEVETVKNGLQELIGTTITQIIVRFPRLRYPLNQAELNLACGQKIQAITRRAKYLLLHLERGYLIYHLGMSGRLNLLDHAKTIGKHDHVDIICNKYILRYTDPRRFGCLVYSADLVNSPLLSKLGPEPLENNFDANYLRGKLQQRRTPIKQIIMDNAVVVGVGNIYACESLFLSKISPLRPANSLSLAECTTLVHNIRQVLTAAIAAGGSSLRDYQTVTGELGYFQHSHYVYAKANQACQSCGSLIQEIRLGQRNSFYCPSCQH